MVVCYAADQIEYVWDEVRPLIKMALDRGSHYTIKDIYHGLVTESMQLWTWKKKQIECALVTTIQEKDGVKFCLYLAMGGTGMSEWKEYMPLIDDWAKENGCTEVRVYGRYGWAKKFGFTPIYTKMSKQI